MTNNVLITGASSGIGREIAILLGKQEYIDGIGIHYNLNKNGILDTKRLIDRNNVSIHQCDLSSNKINIIDEFIDMHGSIDILINCAGVIGNTSFENLTIEEFDRVINTNVRGTFMITKDSFNHMKKKRHGKIINISSITTKFGIGRNHSIQYAASKSMIDTLTIGLARIGAEYNILVNSVSPGLIDTRIQEGRNDLEERVNLIPLKRIGKVKDVANMVEYLASNKGNFITGQVIRVTGGE